MAYAINPEYPVHPVKIVSGQVFQRRDAVATLKKQRDIIRIGYPKAR